MMFFDWLTARIRDHFAASHSSQESVDISARDFLVHFVLNDFVVLHLDVPNTWLVFSLDTKQPVDVFYKCLIVTSLINVKEVL